MVGRCRREEEEFPDQQEHQPSAFGNRVGRFSVPVKTNGIVPAEEDQDCRGVFQGTNDDVGDHERFPGIGFRRALAGFV